MAKYIKAGVKVHADQVEGGSALFIAFQGQRHIDQPRRQLSGETGFQQAGSELVGKAAVHGGRAARAHAVTQDHLGSGRAAELLDRIPGDSALCRRARSSEHGP